VHNTLKVDESLVKANISLYRILPFPILYLYIAIQGGQGDTIYYAIEWAMKAGSEVPKRRDVCQEYY